MTHLPSLNSGKYVGAAVVARSAYAMGIWMGKLGKEPLSVGEYLAPARQGRWRRLNISACVVVAHQGLDTRSCEKAAANVSGSRTPGVDR